MKLTDSSNSNGMDGSSNNKCNKNISHTCAGACGDWIGQASRQSVRPSAV